MKRIAILLALLAFTGCQSDQETTREDSEGAAPQEPTAQFVESTTPALEPPAAMIEHQNDEMQVIQYGSELPETGGLSL